jgi:hypothetical protein
MSGMRMQLAHMRVVRSDDAPLTPLPLPMLIDCLAERLEVLKVDPRVPLGFVPDLIEQAIAHLQRLEQLEASRA